MKKTYNSISLFIKKLEDKTSKIHPVYIKNFRELIKVIPIVGSWIDSNTLGTIEDNILKERLENLENSCKLALKLTDINKLTIEITNINSIFFLLIATNQNELITQNKKIIKNLNIVLQETKKIESTYKPHKEFVLVTISGASAAGKDHLLDLIINEQKSFKKPIEVLTKFTTRKPRISDSQYYDFISQGEYELLEKHGNILFPYFKRGYGYGFDKTHLINSSKKAMTMFSIFTNFTTLAADREFLKHIGIKHIAILLDVDDKSLFIRTHSRLFDNIEKSSRKKSIENDLKYIKENKFLIERHFDLIIKNGDKYAKTDSFKKIVNYLGLLS